MRSFLIMLLECSVTMSVLVLGFIALTPWLSKKYSTKWLYYVWLVSVIGFIITLRLHPYTPLIHNDLFAANIAVQQETSYGSDMTEGGQAQAGIVTGNPGTAANGRGTTSGIMQHILHSPWYLWAGALWILGVVLFTAFHGIRHRRFLRMVRRWGQEVSNQEMLDIL